MSACIIFGGAGYIGNQLATFLLENEFTQKIYVADLRASPLIGNTRIVSILVDVREPINPDLFSDKIDWIFNFAAIHREPGHQDDEYYRTNISGAVNVCDFAEKIECQRILFTSSISVYGPTNGPTDESTLTMPNTPYGVSKLTAELIHTIWAARGDGRKLRIVRPGVIYGPGDPGNILRMINAVRKGYFFLPVTPKIKKSYGYIFGLLDSMMAMMNQPDDIIRYNYVEKDTEMLGEMIRTINEVHSTKGRIVRVPFHLLQVVAFIIHKVNPRLNGIHPARVRKVARPTHIIPKVLLDRKFNFKYDFKTSLLHWNSVSPQDFGSQR